MSKALDDADDRLYGPHASVALRKLRAERALLTLMKRVQYKGNQK